MCAAATVVQFYTQCLLCMHFVPTNVGETVSVVIGMDGPVYFAVEVVRRLGRGRLRSWPRASVSAVEITAVTADMTAADLKGRGPPYGRRRPCLPMDGLGRICDDTDMSVTGS